MWSGLCNLASLAAGEEKSIWEIVRFGTAWLMPGGNQALARSVQTSSSLAFAPYSMSNTMAARWEQASPRPAMQVQWPVIISPSFFVKSHDLSGGRERACE